MNATLKFKMWASQYGITPSECDRMCRMIPEYQVHIVVDPDTGQCDGICNAETGQVHDLVEFASFAIL